MEAELQIIMPAGAFGASEHDDALDSLMRKIAIKYSPDPEDEWAEKYGTNFENESFMMHRFCWCEDEGCLSCKIWLSNNKDCTEKEAEDYRKKQNAELVSLYGEQDWGRHKDPAKPHFWHKPTNFQVRWYKYIGRGMKTNMEFTKEIWEKITCDLLAHNGE
jgi:hypothetical protein